MTKYSFILLNKDTDEFMKHIQALGVMDIKRSTKPVDEQSMALLDKALIVKQALSSLEKLTFDVAEAETIQELSGHFTLADNPALRTKELLNHLTELNSRRDAAEKEKAERRPWGEFDKNRLNAIAEQGYKIHYYKVTKDKLNATWADTYPLQVVEENRSNIWFVIISENSAEYDIPLAECEAPKGTVAESDADIAAIKNDILVCKAELLKLKEAIPQMKREYGNDMSILDLYLAKATKEQAAEDTLSLLVGFAPIECDDKLQGELDKLDAVCLVNKATTEDEPPIKLKNKKMVGMFEVLTDMYGRPDYNEFDPTVFISIFFTLFFAFCMGDAGYGLIIILLGLILRKKGPLAKTAPLIITLGVATLIIGIIFHTFFSIDIAQWGWVQGIGLDRVMLPSKITIPGMGEFDFTMMLALVVGVVHICVAEIIKTVVATKNKGFWGSLGTWGWTLLIVGGVAVGALALLGVLDSAITKTIIIVLGIVSAICIFFLRDLHKNPLLNIGGGLWETYNTATGLLGDVLSYLRLYALGLAGSMLGSAFNQLGLMVLGDGGFTHWIFFLVLLIIGHALNLAMAALGAFVHPLRLNFLEFFKNSGFDGMGRKYAPLTETNQN